MVLRLRSRPGAYVARFDRALLQRISYYYDDYSDIILIIIIIIFTLYDRAHLMQGADAAVPEVP